MLADFNDIWWDIPDYLQQNLMQSAEVNVQ